jgi:acyl-CoA synthetase (AMP-forming)/AMP-acid ligase II
MGILMRQPWRDARRYYEDGTWTSDTLPSLLDRATAERPDHEAFVAGPLRLSWAELHGGAVTAAHALLACGVRAGSPVVVALPDGAAVLAVMVACQAVRAVAVPMGLSVGPAEVRAAVAACGAALVVSDALVDDDLGARVVRSDEIVRWDAGAGPFPVEPGPDPDALADLMFTSGTTGRPKGVMNTANTKLAGLRGFVSSFGFARDDTWGVTAPMSHNAGWLYTALPALATGARTVVVGRGDTERMLDVLTEEEVTATFLVPTHLSDLMTRHAASPERWPLSLRYVVTGAAPASGDLLRRVADDWRAVPISMYGMTECQGNLFTREADDPAGIGGSVGRPCPGAEVALRDPASGAIVAGDGTGEVVTRGATTFVGYYGDQAATSAAFTDDGWFRSGDLGRVADGRFEIVGRVKEVILRGGATVSPDDVETACAGFPRVGEVVAVGLPDDRLGERVCLVVTGAVPDLADLRAFLQAQGFGRHVVPDLVVRVDAVPRTDLGKPKRAAVKELVS